MLDLRWNELGELGGRAILNTIQSNTSIKALEITNNRISEPTMLAIEEYLAIGGRQTEEMSRKAPAPLLVRDL